MRYFDSFFDNDADAQSDLQKIFQKVTGAKVKAEYRKITNHLQTNTYDCGMYVLKFIGCHCVRYEDFMKTIND